MIAAAGGGPRAPNADSRQQPACSGVETPNRALRLAQNPNGAVADREPDRCLTDGYRAADTPSDRGDRLCAQIGDPESQRPDREAEVAPGRDQRRTDRVRAWIETANLARRLGSDTSPGEGDDPDTSPAGGETPEPSGNRDPRRDAVRRGLDAEDGVAVEVACPDRPASRGHERRGPGPTRLDVDGPIRSGVDSREGVVPPRSNPHRAEPDRERLHEAVSTVRRRGQAPHSGCDPSRTRAHAHDRPVSAHPDPHRPVGHGDRRRPVAFRRSASRDPDC